MAYGIYAVGQEVKKIVMDLGCVELFDKVSRVDICVDRPGVNVTESYDLVHGEQYVCRARSASSSATLLCAKFTVLRVRLHGGSRTRKGGACWGGVLAGLDSNQRHLGYEMEEAKSRNPL
ncbi:MAG: hypothetical protein NTU83_05870 [Candidatus Hydrogenedentes bacterium]|nr:hypothetical protein [Candidatus Hydrogenedentota bacterium]